MTGRSEAWAAQELTGFLALISSFEQEEQAVASAVERVAKILDADVAVVVAGGHIEAASEATPLDLDPDGLNRIVQDGSPTLSLPGGAELAGVAAALDPEGGRFLVVARERSFGQRETELLQAMCRVLGMGTRTLRALGAERSLRAGSERQASENELLLDALRERQMLLERLVEVQRAIVAKTPLHEVFEMVADSLRELTGDEISGLRLREAEYPERVTLVAASGLDVGAVASRRRTTQSGVITEVMQAGRLIVIDASSAARRELIGRDWDRHGMRAILAAPVFEREEVVGVLGVASRDVKREFGARDRQIVLAFAEHTSLALNHARALDEAMHEALHDSLTGLANRSLFLDRTRQAVARARRGRIPVAVLFIDLDDFKTVNDSLGHRAGDALLVAVSERLAECVSPGDTIARLGGDEFAVLLEERSDGAAARVASAALEALEEPFELEDREIAISASIGIAAGMGEGELLLRDADLAMYRAKEGGKGRYEAFEPEMHTAIVERMEFEGDLRRAVGNDQLQLAYQPIFRLKSGQISGLEALVRWNHPEHGLISPGRFIPLAEASGRIGEIGRWVLRAACHQGALWRAKYPALPGVRVGVNVSAAQLQLPGLVREVSEALRFAQLDPDGLTLEITETALMQDFETAVTRLRALKRLGVDIAIDDFGMGYSSLSYLKRLPLDNLKIAKEFVDEISKPGGEPAILRAMVDLAEIFGLQPVAEGIETAAQRDFLIELGCELGQGYLLSPAVPVAAADDLILRSGLLTGPAGAGAEGAEVSRSSSAAPPAGAS